MTTSPPPFIECDQVHACLVVGDIPAAVDFYTMKLGFKLGFTWGDPPTFAGVNLGKVQMFLQKGTPEPKGCSVPFWSATRTSSTSFIAPTASNRGGDCRQRIRNPRLCGARPEWILSFLWPPPVQRRTAHKIERVDVPVRLENRLAALLQDLAQHKRMTVNSCLEEMLLHTNDGVGPHTQTTLRYIQELKKRHGIDYDSHASYRFVEE